MKATKRGEKAKPAPPADINKEFCQRFLSLMVSFYDEPSMNPIITFPQTVSDPEAKEETYQPFQSRVIDLRLRRMQDKLEEFQINQNEKIENNLNKIDKKQQELHPELDDLFAPETVQRSSVPYHVQAQQKDAERNAWHMRNRKNKPIDYQEVEREYKQRLVQSKQTGEARAKQRVERIRNNLPNKEFYVSKITQREQEEKEVVRAREPRRREPPVLSLKSPIYE